MIQMWSWASTETPMVWPMIQWFGRGFGHRGLTSKRGAITVAACTVFLSSTKLPVALALGVLIAISVAFGAYGD